MELLSSWCSDGSLPESYVMPPETRPGDLIVPLEKSIPVIDLQHNQPWSFRDLMDETMNVAEEFHAMPGVDKERECTKDPNGRCKLYTSSHVYPREDFHLWRDAVKHPCCPLDDHIQFLPENPTRYRCENQKRVANSSLHCTVTSSSSKASSSSNDGSWRRVVVGAYSVELWKLSCRILELLCEGLGLNINYFSSNDLSQVPKILINHYPPCPEPSLTLELLKHRDPTITTILLQGHINGLQVLKDGRWIGIKPLPRAFVVNIGFLLQVIRNGKLNGAEHRVVTNSRDAWTTVSFFVYPCDDRLIGPAKALVNASNPAIYKAFKFSDFINVSILNHDDETFKELIYEPTA
ncbi:RING/U-box superfamily protein [Hibiscus syriacus]|uniref:RING/U-box superfamily protein n=1 Tax=Hibiscus syriacus TaxID=106335 RepID=A0A6A2YR46_HIBSY|nr:RING/U-box superfamily protein [Hibiscus syriacus]